MGKLINLGWSNSLPQPTSILLGRNLSKNSDESNTLRPRVGRDRRGGVSCGHVIGSY